ERYRRISVNYAQGLLFMHFLPVQRADAPGVNEYVAAR
ncbi:hypothetical protein ACPTHN_31045, partial [Pseudomonas aeruginosa]